MKIERIELQKYEYKLTLEDTEMMALKNILGVHWWRTYRHAGASTEEAAIAEKIYEIISDYMRDNS